MINLSDIISGDNTNKPSDSANIIDIYNETADYDTKVYQLISTVDTNKSTIKHVGNISGDKINIKIGQFKYRNCDCHIISHVYTDGELDEINKTCGIDIMSVLVHKKGVLIGKLTYTYYTFNHVMEKIHIREKIDKEITGFYTYNITCCSSNNTTRLNYIINKYPGKNTIMKDLVSKLSDNTVTIKLKLYGIRKLKI